jgi:hypothetical protein
MIIIIVYDLLKNKSEAVSFLQDVDDDFEIILARAHTIFIS